MDDQALGEDKADQSEDVGHFAAGADWAGQNEPLGVWLHRWPPMVALKELHSLTNPGWSIPALRGAEEGCELFLSPDRDLLICFSINPLTGTDKLQTQPVGVEAPGRRSMEQSYRKWGKARVLVLPNTSARSWYSVGTEVKLGHSVEHAGSGEAERSADWRHVAWWFWDSANRCGGYGTEARENQEQEANWGL